jgi:AcrR family transcriptional regulator
MGNREALLGAAKRCLLDKGYSKTSSRDIANAAGVSPAAIVYHFRSKEALLAEALLLAIEDWEQDFRVTLNLNIPSNAEPSQRFERVWDALISAIQNHRSLWAANFELFAQMDNKPEIRVILRGELQKAQIGLAALFLGKQASEIDAETAKTVGGLYHVLMSGLISQWLMDPEQALSSRRLTKAVKQMAVNFR